MAFSFMTHVICGKFQGIFQQYFLFQTKTVFMFPALGLIYNFTDVGGIFLEKTLGFIASFKSFKKNKDWKELELLGSHLQ